MARCRAVLMTGDVSYRCDLPVDHDGAHTNADTLAVWDWAVPESWTSES